jgi:hypothetical protein
VASISALPAIDFSPHVNPWKTTYYASGRYQGQSTIAGFQLTWEVAGPPPMVGFVPDLSQFGVMHNVTCHLYDESCWSVFPVPAGYYGGDMGGGYDPMYNVLYPSAPGQPNVLWAIQF